MESLGVGAAVTMVILFLKHIEKKDRATNEVITNVTKEYTRGIKDCSNDVKIGLHTFQEQTQTLLIDGREREEKLHGIIQKQMTDETRRNNQP